MKARTMLAPRERGAKVAVCAQLGLDVAAFDRDRECSCAGSGSSATSTVAWPQAS
jgi:hypothetical protein